MELIVGTYGTWLWLLELGAATFAVQKISIFEAKNTSCLALSPDKRFLFAVSESGSDSGLYSFLVHPYDRLKPLPHGRIERISELKGIAPDPCHLLYIPGFYNRCGNPDDGVLLTADYSGGSVSLYPVHAGRLAPAAQVVRFDGGGPVPKRQEASHIHHLVRRGDLVLAADLGADCIHVLRLFDGTVRPLCDGRLCREPRLEKIFDIKAPEGSGPRHMTLSADGRLLYSITELSNEILVYALEDELADEADVKLLQRVPVGYKDFPMQAGGDIQLSPDGKHLYASLRNGDDGMVICDVQPDGTLVGKSFQETGRHVRDFVFAEPDPPYYDLLLAFCKNDRCIQVFRRYANGGGLCLKQEIRIDDFLGEPVFGIPLY